MDFRNSHQSNNTLDQPNGVADCTPSSSSRSSACTPASYPFMPTTAMRASGAEFIMPDLMDELRMYRHLSHEEEQRRKILRDGDTADPITGKIQPGSPYPNMSCTVCIRMGTGLFHRKYECPLNTLNGTKSVLLQIAEAVHALSCYRSRRRFTAATH